MKTTKDGIRKAALALFAESGYDAVSTGMIAGKLGITKGALYRHFENKQAIFDSIIQKMFELDAERAEADRVPAEAFEDSPDGYGQTALADFCSFVSGQFDFWTGDEFAVPFRRMITLEQFKSPERNKLYQDVIGLGPVRYSEDLLREMLATGKLNERAERVGPRNLALELFAPLHLMIQLADGGADREELKKSLAELTAAFAARYGKKE